jgi:hypothetical protein
VVDPSGAEKAVKDYRALLFPEEGMDDAVYAKKAQEMLEKLRKSNIVIKPF